MKKIIAQTQISNITGTKRKNDVEADIEKRNRNEESFNQHLAVRFAYVEPVAELFRIKTLSDPNTLHKVDRGSETEVDSGPSPGSRIVLERADSVGLVDVQSTKLKAMANVKLALKENYLEFQDRTSPKLQETDLADFPTYSRNFLPKNLFHGAMEFQNARYKFDMEDKMTVVKIQTPRISGRYYMLCDGHGTKDRFEDNKSGGALAAEFFSTSIPKYFEESLMQSNEDIELLINRAFEASDIAAKEKPWAMSAGTTAVFVFIPDTPISNTALQEIYIANVGDSGAILCGNNYGDKVTRDHSILSAKKSDKERILKSGMDIRQDRVVSSYGWLNLARSLGNYGHAGQNGVVHEGHKGAVSGTPDVFVVPILPNERLVIASDGVLDVLPPEYIARAIKNEENPFVAASILISAAEALESKDNMAVMIVNL